MKRLFFALWPDEQTRQQCAEVQKLLPSQGYKTVAAHNLHVTLVFLGNVDRTTELALLKAAAIIPVREVKIIFDQLSFWKKPKILCLTGRSVDNELPRLVEELTGMAKELAIAVDERPYQAHVTLARKAKQAVSLGFEPISWQANKFCLVESCSLPTGVEYRICQSWPE